MQRTGSIIMGLWTRMTQEKLNFVEKNEIHVGIPENLPVL